MHRSRLGILLGGLVLAACEHTQPPSGVSDRWTGPWTPGTPAQLSSRPVGVLGLSADGREVLFTVGRGVPITGPDGKRTPQDTRDVCLGSLPATGGSGTFMRCDIRPGQEDSLNGVVAAALNSDGRLLEVRSTGPIDFVSPVREHLELYLGSAMDPSVRQFVMTLYRDQDGTPTVASGTVNWLTDLTWVGADRFAALGHHVRPSLTLQLEYVGIVVGSVATGARSTTILTNRTRPFHITAGPAGTILLVYGSGEVAAISPTGEDQWVAQIPIPTGGRMLGAGCHAAGCLAVTEGPPTGQLTRWRFGPGGGDPIAGASSQANGPVARLWVSARDGALIFTASGGLFRFD